MARMVVVRQSLDNIQAVVRQPICNCYVHRYKIVICCAAFDTKSLFSLVLEVSVLIQGI